MLVKVLGALGVAVAVVVTTTIWGIMSGRILSQATGRDEFLGFLFTVLQVELVGTLLWVAQEEYKRSRRNADEKRSQQDAALRARSDARRRYLEDTTQRLRHAYVGVKRCRRILKARLRRQLEDTQEFDVPLLHTLGEALMQHQLELEGLKWETIGAVRPGGVLTEHPEIPGHLKMMEEYANRLSKALIRFSTPPEKDYVDTLRDCVADYKGTDFAARFGGPYDSLTDSLMALRAA